MSAAPTTTPSVLTPNVVVDAPGLRIEEHVGLTSNGEAALSIARVVVTGPHLDPAHTPQFDEYILVLSGEVHIAGGGRAPLVALAGQTLYLPKGHSYAVTTPGPAEYIPVCSPAFHPSLKG